MGSVSNKPDIRTLGELRAAGYTSRTLREELRHNLLGALAAGRDPWPGMHGFATTVIPQLERAIIAGHDIVLLGERGQGKTRLLRTLVGLLDEWSPVVADTELWEDPLAPITGPTRERIAREGDALPIEWRHRSERYVEKLSTPDTSVADMIGDVDPMRVAEGRRMGDPETIHYGLVPRVGLELVVPTGFEQLSWYGRGPEESYCDRKAACPVGNYACTVEETHFPFIPVSENGAHCDTRTLTLSDGEHTLTVEGSLFSFDAHHNTIEEYRTVRHEHELHRHPETYLHIDGFRSGIGGDMAWSTEINPKDVLHAGDFRFGFVLRFA